VLPVLFSVVVLFWVSGFDIIYALQDEDFDKSLNLNSIPVRLGRRGALQLSNILHLICGLVMIYAVFRVNTEGVSFEIIHTIGASVFIGLLIYQHTLVKEDDLSKVNMAFFTTNGIASVIYGASFILDFFF
jgi:4-hydroxybenzoate polyprenyltransferase